MKIENQIEEVKSIRIFSNQLNDNGSIGIGISHIIDNVRVNGRERKVSLIDILNESKQLKKDIREKKKSILSDEKLILKILQILSDYHICSICKGEQGIYYGKGHPHSFWEDCPNCDGIGLLKKS